MTLPPSDPSSGTRGVDGGEAATLYQALAEGILALGVATGEEELFEVLLARAQCVYPAENWAIGEMVDPDSESREVVIRAETPSLGAWFGGSVKGRHYPVMGREFTVRVYEEQRPAFFPDAPDHPEGIHPDFAQRFKVRSLLGIPLLFDGRSVGGLFAVTFLGQDNLPDRPAAFEALLTLARVAAMALHKLRAQAALAEQLQRARRLNAQLANFQEVTSELAIQRDVGLAMMLVLRMAQEAAGIGTLELLRVVEDGTWMESMVCLGVPLDQYHPRARYAVDGPEGGLPGRAVRAGERRLLVTDLDPGQRPLGATSGAAFLIRGREGGLLGVMAIYGRDERPVTEADLQALGPFASLAGLALERNRLWDQLQQELRERRVSEARYRQLFDDSVEPILIGTPEGYQMANAAALSLLGRRLDELIGRPAGFFSPPFQPCGRSSIELGLAHMKEALKGGPVRFECLAERPDGTRIETEVTLARIPNPGPPLFQVILRDLTDIKRARREMESLERQLFHAQKLESLGVLAGGIAHDFNNLLMGVLGHAGLALSEPGLAPATVQHLEAIQKAGQRAADLTRQLLAYSGRGKFLIEVLDLSAQVEDLLSLVEVSLPKGVALDLRLGQGLPAVLADPAQVQQVVLNLVLNAAEAIGEGGGRISLTTTVQVLRAEDLGRFVDREGVEPGTFLVFEVADTGAGMDGPTLARIFEPFFTTKFTGRGLGLSATQGIVRGHHGALEVHSVPGTGTTFRVYLPVAGVKAEAAMEGPAPGPLPGGRCILVVDDEPVPRTVAAQVLEAGGFQVVEARDGVEALEVANRMRGDLHLVLLDLTMPRMGGIEAFRALRALDPALKVVMTSGYSEQEVTRDLGGQVPDGFIQKPYRPRDLQTLLTRILGA